MKSQVNGLLEVAIGVLADYQSAYPHDKRDVVRDIERLTRLVKERGIGVFLLDLPALDGPLLRGLESGRLVVSGALSKRASASTQVPRLFRGLWKRIFDSVGNLKEDADPTAIFFLRQLLCLGKKVEVECSAVRTQSVLKEYYHVEQSARSPTFSWGNCELGSDDSCSFDDLFDRRTIAGGCEQLELWDESPNEREVHPHRDVFGRLQRNFDAFSQAIGQLNVEEFLLNVQQWSGGLGFRHGPGAVSDLTSKEYKYDFPTWPDKLGARFPFSDFGTIADASPSSEGRENLQPYQTEIFGYTERESGPDGIPGECVPHGTTSPGGFVGENSVELSGISNLVGRAVCTPADQGFSSPSRHEPPSRLIAVPKTAKGPRLIAAEPTAHQWCQQFIKRFLEERLLGLFGTNFISFRDQGLSQLLVTKASLDRSLATVDLSSASDRLSCWVVERAFRKNQTLLKALHASRTRWVKDVVSNPHSPNYFIPKKFASQGTAVTFPVQSIIFLIIALTASGFEAKGPEDFICNNKIDNLVGRFRDKVRVFGDDIIIPVHGYVLLTRMLHSLGLKVNTEKSFHRGSFRESCGMDSFKGQNVTPIKTTKLAATGPQSRQSLIDYSNNLHQAGLWNAAAVVESIIPGWVISNLPVIGIGLGGVGRSSFSGSTSDHLRKRWNPKLQRYEQRVYGITSRSKRVATNTLSGLLQYFTEAPRPIDKWVHGIPGRPKTSDGLRWEFPHSTAISECRLR